jgi:hypothetical protein
MYLKHLTVAGAALALALGAACSPENGDDEQRPMGVSPLAEERAPQWPAPAPAVEPTRRQAPENEWPRIQEPPVRPDLADAPLQVDPVPMR